MRYDTDYRRPDCCDFCRLQDDCPESISRCLEAGDRCQGCPPCSAFEMRPGSGGPFKTALEAYKMGRAERPPDEQGKRGKAHRRKEVKI